MILGMPAAKSTRKACYIGYFDIEIINGRVYNLHVLTGEHDTSG